MAQQRRLRLAALLPALALAVLLAAPRPAAADVLPGDKAALLAFKDGLTAAGGELLASWQPASDPCIDAWTGVRCSCADFFESQRAADGGNVTARVGWVLPPRRAAPRRPPQCLPLSAAAEMRLHHVSDELPCPSAPLPPLPQVCQQPGGLPDGKRVLQLNFGDPRITRWNTLTGTVAPALANLTGAPAVTGLVEAAGCAAGTSVLCCMHVPEPEPCLSSAPWPLCSAACR